MTAFEGAVGLQSRGKCCNVARANTPKSGNVHNKHPFRSAFRRKKMTTGIRQRFDIGDFGRVQSACNMLYNSAGGLAAVPVKVTRQDDGDIPNPDGR
jgi:hypothetical protein